MWWGAGDGNQAILLARVKNASPFVPTIPSFLSSLQIEVLFVLPDLFLYIYKQVWAFIFLNISWNILYILFCGLLFLLTVLEIVLFHFIYILACIVLLCSMDHQNSFNPRIDLTVRMDDWVISTFLFRSAL